LPRNVSGGAIALINSLGALGSFVGAYIVGYLNGVTGNFSASYIFMAGSLFLSAILTMIAVKSPVKGRGIKMENTENKIISTE
jgi:MFS-type transporter involved in bile tolerance (Atg22 family)